MAYVINAANKVANTTPRALYSKFFCSNKKNTAKLGSAPNANNIHKLPSFTKPLNVTENSEDLTVDINNVQIITPNTVVIIPKKNPLNTSCLIFKIPCI